jgi:hypothetical protein
MNQSASALRNVLESRSPESIWTRGLRDLPTSVKALKSDQAVRGWKPLMRGLFPRLRALKNVRCSQVRRRTAPPGPGRMAQLSGFHEGPISVRHGHPRKHPFCGIAPPKRGRFAASECRQNVETA